MAKKTEQIVFDGKIIENNLEDIMHSSFMTYSEYVILERALPRVEDGLKPVQRRILYTMSELGLTPDKPYKKSARIVGEALGKYHPHGDTSVYDAMVRLAQDFAMRVPMVDGHGNFGSMDGDGAAAMRYTEARLAPVAMEMLRDLDKDTVPFRPNFDDSEWEPDMLPARFPNLLVNGSSGIAVGIATNIPPHNLAEVVEGTIYRMDNPSCGLDELLDIIKGPDFPTGGYIVESPELRTAYETGKGKIAMRAKTSIEKGQNGKSLIVISEVPYETNKQGMLAKMLAVSEEKRNIFGCIDEIRDESDREGIRGVIEVKKGCDPQKILALLFKYTELEKTFGINMNVIAGGVPAQLGLIPILDAYIAHQKDVVTRRTQFDLEKAEKREHILAGLIIAVQNIEEVIRVIRSSKDAKEAKKKLMERFNLTGVQAQAILDMRLARLTNLEIETLMREHDEVMRLIAELNAILASEKKLMGVIKKELIDIKNKYGEKRRTGFISRDGVETVDESEFKVTEECVVVLTNGSGLKRMSPKALQKGAEGLEEKAEPRLLISATTDDKLSVFTSKGNLYQLSAGAIPEGRLKDAGKQLNAIIAGVDKGESIVNIFCLKEFSGSMIFATKQGLVKKTELSEFDVKKSKILACGLKDGDEIIYCGISKEAPNMLFVTGKGMSICINKDEISTMGRAGKGVGAIKMAIGDEVIFAAQTAESGEMVLCVTEKGFAKKTPVSEYEVQGRNGKGLKTYALGGQVGSRIAAAMVIASPAVVSAAQAAGDISVIRTDDIPIAPRNAKGEQVVLALMGNDVVKLKKRIFE